MTESLLQLSESKLRGGLLNISVNMSILNISYVQRLIWAEPALWNVNGSSCLMNSAATFKEHQRNIWMLSSVFSPPSVMQRAEFGSLTSRPPFSGSKTETQPYGLIYWLMLCTNRSIDSLWWSLMFITPPQLNSNLITMSNYGSELNYEDVATYLPSSHWKI